MLIDRSWGCSQDAVHGNTRKFKVRVAGWIYLAIALLLMFPGLSAFAQYENGSLVGTIHDCQRSRSPRCSGYDYQHCHGSYFDSYNKRLRRL